jgi:hypothetical protein
VEKQRSILFLFAVVFFYSCSSDIEIFISEQPAKIHLVKTLGGSKNESARSVVKTNDGGYLVLGYSQSIDGDISIVKTTIQYDIWLLKYNDQDQLQWQKFYGGSKDDKGYKVIQTIDNGFAVVGYSKSNDGDLSFNAGFEDVWVLKLNTFGDVEWKTNTGFSGTDKASSIIQTTDGGYFVGSILDVTASGGLGNSKKSQHAGGDFWGIKLTSNGVIEWRKYFGGSNTDACYDVIEVLDGYIMIGSSDSSDVDIKGNKGGYDFWVVKIDKKGSQVWEKSFGGKEIDEAYQILKTSDDNFLLVGETRSSDADVTNQKGGADVWIVKMNTEGTIIWQKTYGGTNFDVARAGSVTQDGNYLITGSTRSIDVDVDMNNGLNDVWVLKINPSGKLLWQKSIGGSDIDFAFDIKELNDKSIVIVGESNSNDKDVKENKGFTDLLIIKLK